MYTKTVCKMETIFLKLLLYDYSSVKPQQPEVYVQDYYSVISAGIHIFPECSSLPLPKHPKKSHLTESLVEMIYLILKRMTLKLHLCFSAKSY